MPITRATLGPLESVATYALSGKINNDVKSKKIASIVNEERNLPSTICVVDTGEVSKSCSVLVLFSSLKIFIVRTGKNSISTKIIPEKNRDVSAVEEKTVVIEKIIADTTKEQAKKIYPIDVVK